MINITSLIASLQNPDAVILRDANDIPSFIDTGCYALNALISGSIFGGIAQDRIISFAGPEATGKSFFTLAICKNYLNMHPEAVIFYFESENATDKQMVETRKIDSSRMVRVPVVTVEEFRSQALRLVEKYTETPLENRTPMMIVLDSLGMLSTLKETTDVAAGSDTRDMTRSQLIKATFRLLTLKCGNAKVPMIVTNHTYDQMGGNTKPGMPAAKIASGGSGLKYAASTIIFLDKKNIYDEKEKEYTGNMIVCKTSKSRFTRQNQKIDVELDYTGGMNRYHGLLDIAKESGAIQFANGYYEIDGKKFRESQIMADTKRFFTDELMAKIDAGAGKLFKYGGWETPPAEEEEE